MSDQEISALLPVLSQAWETKLQELATANAVIANLQTQQMQIQEENTQLKQENTQLKEDNTQLVDDKMKLEYQLETINKLMANCQKTPEEVLAGPSMLPRPRSMFSFF